MTIFRLGGLFLSSTSKTDDISAPKSKAKRNRHPELATPFRNRLRTALSARGDDQTKKLDAVIKKLIEDAIEGREYAQKIIASSTDATYHERNAQIGATRKPMAYPVVPKPVKTATPEKPNFKEADAATIQ